MSAHLHIVGACARDRRPFLERPGARPGAVFGSCHKGLRGPYTGVDTVLGAVLPDAFLRWPELVDYHRMEILEAVPELSEIIGPGVRSLAAGAPFVERTRWYGRIMTRSFSQGIVTFLREYAERLREVGAVPPPLVFDDAHRAEVTTQEFVALFLRRVDAELWPAVVGTDGDSPLEPALAVALADYTEWQYAPAIPETRHRSGDELVAEYVQLDGTCDDPRAFEAYLALGPDDRAALHDKRAQVLEAGGGGGGGCGWGVRVAALVYHRERGSDHALSVAAVEEAAEYLTVMGFQHAAVDMCERGRLLTDPESDGEADAYRKFSHILIAQVMGLGRLHEATELCGELRRRYAHAATHMLTSHFMAVIYSRFATPRDYDRALEHQNSAVVIANGLADERDRAICSSLQDNGLAVIEMQRGRLGRALELVEGAIARIDGRLGEGEWVLHRSQLSYNRARLLAALGRRVDEAYDAFTALHEMDPHYTDYLLERAKLSRQRGELEAAVADYSLAAELGPPFVELYYERGCVLAELGRVDEALADFDHVLDMEPDDGETLLSRAELLLDEGHLDAAAADVERAMTLFAPDVRLYCLRGMIHLAAGDPSHAVVCFDAALELAPDYPAALVNRAVALFELCDPNRSVADLTRALELSQPDPALLLKRGMGAHRA